MPNGNLTVFADNKDIFDAVKAAVLKEFQDDEINSNMTNDHIGEVTRARVEGIKKVERAFLKIASMKTAKETVDKPHPTY